MTPKLRRWMDLLATLLRRRYPVSFEELAAEVPAYQNDDQAFDARRRMFERDKKELRGFGVPIETRDIGDGELGYALNRAQFYLPYLHLLRDGRKSTPSRPGRYGYRSLPSLTFEPDELAAVFQAARRVATLGVPSLVDDARSAVRKLGHDLPLSEAESDDGVHHLNRGPETDEGVFMALSEALSARKRVSFAYHSMNRDTVSERTVEPFGLFFLGHHWYLAAAAPGAELVKNYRLSRMQDVRPNAASPGTPDYSIPKKFSLRRHAKARQAWELGSGDATEVTIRVPTQTGAALAASKLGEPVDSDPTVRRFRVRRLDAFVRWVMGAGGAVVPVTPPEFVALYRDQVAATAAVYQDGGEPWSNAAAQLRRILALIPECADDRPHRITDVASRAGTDPGTLLRDVRALSERFDDPGGFVEAVQIFVEPDRLHIRSDHFLRPMRLTVAELSALDLGLAVLASERPPDELVALRGARDRLEAAMAKLPDDVGSDGMRHAGLPELHDPTILAALRRGYRESRKVRLRYRKAGAAEPSVRVVCPFAILFASGQWYLVGQCEDVDGIRVFRVDRIESSEVLDDRYRPPEEFTVAEIFRDGRAFASEVAERVRIRFAPRVARWIAEREGQDLADDGSFVLELPLADPDWVVRYVLQYGPDAVVLGPESARAAVRRRLEAMAAGIVGEKGQ